MIRPLLARSSVFAFLALALAQSGCIALRSQTDRIEQKTQDLETRVAKLENEIEEEQKRLTTMIDRAHEDVEKLEETLTKATRVLARNSADFGAEMETVKNKLRAIDGALAEIRYDVKEFGKQAEQAAKRVNDVALAAGLDVAIDESEVPEGAGAHFQSIKTAFAAGKFSEVRALGTVYLERYPKNADADDVHLYVAKSYLEQKRWAKALGSLRRFTDVYPTSEHAPEVLYDMAWCFFNLGDCTDARILVEAVQARHRKSPFATKAKELADQMKKNKSRCTS